MDRLQQVFAAVRPNLEPIIARARQGGVPDRPLGVLITEQSGRARVDCLERALLLTSVRSMHSDQRVLAEIEATSAGAVPVVVCVAGDIAVWHVTPPGQRRAGFRIDDEIELGKLLLKGIVPVRGEPVTAWMERLTVWCEKNPLHRRTADLVERLRAPSSLYTVGWTIAWALSFFQRVVVPHKLGAALMATNVGSNPEELPCPSWDAFTVEFPPDLVELEIDGRMTSFDAVTVWHLDGRLYMGGYSRTSTAAFTGPVEFPLRKFDFDDDHEAAWQADCTAIQRARDMMVRLAIGVELEMSSPENVKAPRPGKLGGRAGETIEPSGVHRLIRPVTVDCREHAYIAGTLRKSPSVSTFVCGTWAHQPHGPRSSLRKWIQRAPHPRNLGKPPAVRPHILRDE